MKACMVAYSFYESDNRVRRYAETLAKRGDSVDVLTLRRERQPAYEVISGVNVFRIQRRLRNEKNSIHYLVRMLKFFLRSMWFMAVHHALEGYDLVHVHSVPDFEVFASLIPRLFGARVILDIHDIVPEFYASKFGVAKSSLTFRGLLLVEKLSALFAHHVIIANDLWHERITRRSVPAHKCSWILNYPDRSIFFPRPRSSANVDDFVMCYPGTINHHQGVDIAVQAVAQLKDKVPNLKFLIIGDGPERNSLQALVRDLHLEERVIFLGPVSIEEIAEHMANVDLGVVPKRADAFGNEAFSTKILEFMAMGVPVVASNTLIDQRHFGKDLLRFFQSGNPTELAAAILELVNHPEKRDQLRARGCEFIRENSWDFKKHDYLRLVERPIQRVLPLSDPAVPGAFTNRN